MLRPLPSRSLRKRRSSAGDAADFSRALEDLARIYQLQDPRRTCTYGITLTECYTLEAIVENGPRTVNQVAAVLALDKSTASRAVSSLVRKGLAVRRSHPSDGRSVEVSATPAGGRLYRRIRETGRESHRKLLESVAPGVRRAVATVIQRLATTERSRAGSSRSITTRY